MRGYEKSVKEPKRTVTNMLECHQKMQDSKRDDTVSVIAFVICHVLQHTISIMRLVDA